MGLADERVQGAPSFGSSAKGGGRTMARKRFVGVNGITQVIHSPPLLRKDGAPRADPCGSTR